MFSHFYCINFFFFFNFTILCWFCHTSTWICHGIHVFPILNHPRTSLLIPFLWVIPVHQPQASCILHRTWTGDSFLIWYYTCFNAILPNHPTLSLSHGVQKTVLYICVSFYWRFSKCGLPPHQHCLGICWKCSFSGPAPDLLTWNPWRLAQSGFSQAPRWCCLGSPVVTMSRVTFPSLAVNSASVWPVKFFPPSHQGHFSVTTLCEHKGPSSSQGLGENSGPHLLFQLHVDVTFTQQGGSIWSYLDLIVPCWGGVAAPLRPASELPVGGPGWPVCVSLLCRCGRSIVCVIFTWRRKGKGRQIRELAECLLLWTIIPEPSNSKMGGLKGSSEGKDHVGSKLTLKSSLNCSFIIIHSPSKDLLTRYSSRHWFPQHPD